MLSQYDNIIFDLDGTLINSSEEVLRCFEKAFDIAEYEIDKSKLTSDIIGPPLIQILKTIAPNLTNEEKIAEIISNFRQIYDFDENDISVMYSGILELLVYLKNKNKKLFIATFKPQIPTIRITKMFKLESFFEDIYTIDKFGKPISKDEMITDIITKYNLNKSKTAMVGDAPSDVIAAKKAGIDGIGVLWGYGTDKSKLKENSTCIIKEVDDFLCLK